MKRNANLLKTLHTCSKNDRKVILGTAKRDQINAICDCLTNIVYGKVPISSQMKTQLKKKKKILKDLVNPKIPTVKKKSLLVQHGGNIIFKALGSVLNFLLGG